MWNINRKTIDTTIETSIGGINLAVAFTPRAHEYIVSKGGNIIVSTKKELSQFSCCGSGEIACPMVQTGRPPNSEMQQYCQMNVDKIELYVHRSIHDVLNLTKAFIELEKTMFGKKLVMYGVEMGKH